MNENIVKRNEKLAQKVIKGLESRNMKGYYAASKEEALEMALKMIPEGSTVTMGGGMSVHEIGLADALKKGNYQFIDRGDEARQKRGGADQRAAVRAGHAVLQDRRVHELQIAGYDLLSVFDHAVFQRKRPGQRDPGQR